MKISANNFEICAFNPSDYISLFQLLDSNKSRLKNFFAGTLSNTKTLLATQWYCKKMVELINQKSYFPFIISDLETKQFIGLVDVKNIDWETSQAEIGYFIDTKFEGKGISTHAVAYVVNQIIKDHNFKKLLCRISNENVGSQYVAIKNGFKLEETRKNDYKTSNGNLVNLDYYTRYF